MLLRRTNVTMMRLGLEFFIHLPIEGTQKPKPILGTYTTSVKASRRTMLRLQGGIGRQPTRDTHKANLCLASCTPVVWAWRRMIPKRRSGSARLPSRETRTPKLPLASYTSTAWACRRTTARRRDGTAGPRIKVTPQQNRHLLTSTTASPRCESNNSASPAIPRDFLRHQRLRSSNIRANRSANVPPLLADLQYAIDGRPADLEGLCDL